MLVEIFEGYWTVDDVRKRKDMIFVFGDNDCKLGTKGQALIRYEKNSHGIPTKKYPGYNKSAYYSDDDFDDNKEKITNAIQQLVEKLKDNKYVGVFFPKDGLGTGLADLANKAPKTFHFLNSELEKVKKIIEKIE